MQTTPSINYEKTELEGGGDCKGGGGGGGGVGVLSGCSGGARLSGLK